MHHSTVSNNEKTIHPILFPSPPPHLPLPPPPHYSSHQLHSPKAFPPIPHPAFSTKALAELVSDISNRLASLPHSSTPISHPFCISDNWKSEWSKVGASLVEEEVRRNAGFKWGFLQCARGKWLRRTASSCWQSVRRYLR